MTPDDCKLVPYDNNCEFSHSNYFQSDRLVSKNHRKCSSAEWWLTTSTIVFAFFYDSTPFLLVVCRCSRRKIHRKKWCQRVFLVQTSQDHTINWQVTITKSAQLATKQDLIWGKTIKTEITMDWPKGLLVVRVKKRARNDVNLLTKLLEVTELKWNTCLLCSPVVDVSFDSFWSLVLRHRLDVLCESFVSVDVYMTSVNIIRITQCVSCTVQNHSETQLI